MKLTDFIKKHPFVLCLSAGILYSVQFLTDYTFVFAFAGLALYFATLFSAERKAFFRLSYVFCMGFFLPLYYWFTALYPFEGFGFSSAEGIFIVILACVGISLYHSLLTSAVMWLFRFLPKNKYILPLLFGCLWVCAEWLLSLGQLSFSWGKTAIGQASFLPMVETASLLGSYFITFIVAAVSAYIGLFIVTGDKKALVTGLAIVAVNLSVGTVILFSQPKYEDKTDIAIIQGCVTSADKWQTNSYRDIVNNYVSLCTQASDEGAKVLFLPESPFPRYSSEDYEVLAPLKEVAMDKGVTIFTGVLLEDDNENNYNAIVAVYPDGSVSDYYAKRHPVPFGEFIPYGELLISLFPPLGNMNMSEGLTAGEDTGIIKWESFNFSPLVCFDSIFSSFSREACSNGADIIYVATNDSWYKSTRGVYQHKYFSVLRAIENGKYVVRSANTGISCIIDGRGRVICETEPMERTILYGSMERTNTVTLYTLIGDIWLYICIFVSVTCVGYTIYKTKRKQALKYEN